MAIRPSYFWRYIAGDFVLLVNRLANGLAAWLARPLAWRFCSLLK
ncbi:hypothetical protein SAMN04515620_16813 [Collimonas sp. OK607]|nr:hypothetical protein [Collimonas sp. OK607]SFB40509.1 hypothetical protein SAMN04515620_16813 [Collimonas sp. OK607]